MRSTLPCYISPKRFGFLQDIQIHDVVAIAQECMHSIHKKHLNVVVMKVDLKKAYDCLDLGYLILVLHKICLQPRSMAWIMACVTNVNYVVLINEYPTHFFRVGRGLR